MENTLQTFETEGFKIERNGKIFTLTSEEMCQFRELEKALIGKDCIETIIDDCDYTAEEMEILKEAMESASICCDIENIILDILMEDSGETEFSVINDYLAKKKFEKWCNHLSSDDIDLVDKLDNMCGSEISEEVVKTINNDKSRYYPRIESYIKNHVAEYKGFVVNETMKLFNEELITSVDDYSSGLYNCDEIYARAIHAAVNKD